MTYDEFNHLWYERNESYFWLHSEQNMNIGGGCLTLEEINRLNEINNTDKIMISGLRQDTFEYFVIKYAIKYKYIKFFKNKFVEDLSLLSTLENVKYIEYFLNQRASKLWDMSNNKCLEGLALCDFSRLHSLDGVQTAPSLKHLHFGDAVWNKNSLININVLMNTNIESFSFSAKRIENHDISVYWHMQKLKNLDIPGNILTTEELAKIVAFCPNVEGISLKPYVEYELRKPLNKNVFICGKNKPSLNSEKDKVRINKYTDEFNKLVKMYRESIDM